MWKRVFTDRNKNRIWLTEERWNHIVEGHPEIADLFVEFSETIKRGKSEPFRSDPSKFKYKRRFDHLLPDFNNVVVIVRLWPKKFVITAYAILEEVR